MNDRPKFGRLLSRHSLVIKLMSLPIDCARDDDDSDRPLANPLIGIMSYDECGQFGVVRERATSRVLEGRI